MVYAMDHNNSVIKRLWCTYEDSKQTADVQADLSLCWLHKSYCRFCCVLAQLVLRNVLKRNAYAFRGVGGVNSDCFCLLPEKGSALKGKNSLESKFVPFRVDLFSEGGGGWGLVLRKVNRK